MLRRDLLRLRHAVGPLVDVCGRLSTSDLPQIRPAMQPMFRDVTDHIRTVQEKIDSSREVLAFAFEASLLVGQSQETAIAKRLASWAAILAVPTAIAGIYGMNFKNMPELEMQFGYYTVIVAIFALCGILYWRFRKKVVDDEIQYGPEDEILTPRQRTGAGFPMLAHSRIGGRGAVSDADDITLTDEAGASACGWRTVDAGCPAVPDGARLAARAPSLT